MSEWVDAGNGEEERIVSPTLWARRYPNVDSLSPVDIGQVVQARVGTIKVESIRTPDETKALLDEILKLVNRGVL